MIHLNVMSVRIEESFGYAEAMEQTTRQLHANVRPPTDARSFQAPITNSKALIVPPRSEESSLGH
jgi:hypothetical protein